MHLRPDPTRVVRSFKPATEPRDLNPTDKIRANHIVERVLRLDTEAAERQLSDVLENFDGLLNFDFRKTQYGANFFPMRGTSAE